MTDTPPGTAVVLSKKVCLLGEFAVGKTSLVRRFVYDEFDERYLSTIGVSVCRKAVVVPAGEDLVQVTMLIWDIASDDLWSRMRASYLRGAAGAILVYDFTRPHTLDALQTYEAELLQLCPRARFIMIGNKGDLVDPAACRAEVARVGLSTGLPTYGASAKSGADVDLAFRHLAGLLVGRPGEAA